VAPNAGCIDGIDLPKLAMKLTMKLAMPPIDAQNRSRD